MNHARKESSSDWRQVIGPEVSVYPSLISPLMDIGSRLQSRTCASGSKMRRRVQVALATVLVFVALVLASPTAFAQTLVAAPATGQPASQEAARKPIECDILGQGKSQGCFANDPRLGPRRPPTTSSADGSAVARAVAFILKDYHRFGILKPMTEKQFLGKYWKKDVSQCPNPGPKGRAGWCYPPDDGFALDKNHQPIIHVLTLEPGTVVDRFGLPSGFFLAPVGTPLAERALPPQSLDTYVAAPGSNNITYHYNYHVYVVLKPFTVDEGPIAPGFNQKGKGTQYRTCLSSDGGGWQCVTLISVQDLIDQGDLQEEAWPN